MAGGFSTRNLLKGENAFAAQIPSVISTGRVKKRVIVSDFSLPFINGEVMVLMLTAIDFLMQQGFEVYTVKAQNNPILTPLSADPAKCDLRDELNSLLPITVETVTRYDKEYSADGTVLLDYINQGNWC